MNASELLAAFHARKPKMRAVHVEGVGAVYMRDQTVGEINAELDNRRDRFIQLAREQGIPFDDEDEASIDAAVSKVKDPHRLSRHIARRMCAEDGTRIFDPDNVADLLVIENLEESVFDSLNKRIQEDAPKN